jgi:hypothetical protein
MHCIKVGDLVEFVDEMRLPDWRGSVGVVLSIKRRSNYSSCVVYWYIGSANDASTAGYIDKWNGVEYLKKYENV